jgi:2-polyprenyl-3-methyl-5-hydroxy-6-metoxy-1,4-benzoquinol methylase
MRAFAHTPIDHVRDYWDRRPCNVRHSPAEVGTRQYFDEVEARKYFVEPHILRLAQFERWRDKRVLEIGCGIGTDTIRFARAGAQVTAVDLSRASLELARRRAAVYGLTDQVRFYEADAEHLAEVVPPEPYHLVYSFGVIHHSPQPERILEQVRQSFVAPGSTLKLMVYHKYSWKVFWILATYGRGAFWRLDDLVAQNSEAQTGCPITYTYSRQSLRRLLEPSFSVQEAWVDHIFPYRIADYVEYQYVREWYFRYLPPAMFRWLERHFGWHLCVTAQVP